MRAIFFCVLACGVTSTYAQAPRVVTSQGTIVGNIASDGNYFVYYGIHYGGPTAGVNRFKAPTPPPPYPGEYHAIDNSIICAQPSPRGLIGVENCLVLNVHTKDITSSKPVLVWLYGEEYSNTENVVNSFRRLVEEGLVVVSLNYRLSIFGFLCLGVPEAPGNAGLKDVVQGLKWIKQNIAGFGGDPNNVILFGHGSGAAMVDLLTMSPLSKDLVHKAITQSGSALAPWAIAYNPIGYASTFGETLGYSGKSNKELANLLVKTDLNVLASALNEFDFYNNTPLFAPCIENKHLNPNETFLSDAPLNILRSGEYSQIPYITGYTDMEGSLRAPQALFDHWLEKMQDNFTEFLPIDLKLDTDASTNVSEIIKSIREFYFEKRPINKDTLDDFIDYEGDTMILLSTIRGAKERAATSKAEVRLYEFTYKGTLNSDWAFPQIPLSGARHGVVLNYLLDRDLKPSDEIARKAIVNRYVAFAYGNIPPNSSWLPVNKDINYLHIEGSDTPNIPYSEINKVNPHQQRTNFWDNLYSKYYIAPKPVSSSNQLLAFTIIIFLGQFLLRLIC